jgi:Zn-dependent M16 (insulinase) family peptidase
MNIGDKLFGWTIVAADDLGELRAKGIFARHSSGAELYHILNDDEENAFAYAFATARNDSTGVAHIVEHTVLCGSKKYPLKDAFLVLAQGSLQTYLNAWTFPDKTVYPASSIDETDYFNLMNVYGDAVFCPNLDEWAFMQEGRRFEYGENGELQIQGVVYNEMKGVYSALDEYAGMWSIKSVLQGTPYEYESGGDPEFIPDLTYEQFKKFHADKYCLANCKIFLAGNIPTEKQLAFLNDNFFSLDAQKQKNINSGVSAPEVNLTRRWDAPKTWTVASPPSEDNAATVFISWLPNPKDSVEVLALQVLSEILMGHDGSPVTRSLVESGLGEDMASVNGFENELRENVFTIGLRGVTKAKCLREKNNAIEKLIYDELNKLCDKINPHDVDAALLSIEFSAREVRRAGGPYSLVWLRKVLRPWIHGGNPTEMLLFEGPMAELKKQIANDDRYFEKLLKRQYVDNPHHALVIVKPADDFLSNKETQLQKKLNDLHNKLTLTERNEIKEKSLELQKIQNTPDSKEALASIPHLKLSDLTPKIETIPRELVDANGVPALLHDLWTNGITYFDFAFPLDVLDIDDYIYLPIFSRAVTSLGVKGLDYGEMSGLLAETLGDVYTILRSGANVDGTANRLVTPSGTFDLAGRDWLIYRVKTLDEKIDDSLDLVLRLILEANFDDTRRLRDLIIEMKNDADSSLAPSGHSYASCRASASFSRTKSVDEVWHGIAQLNFAHELLERDIAEVSKRLKSIRDKLTSRAGVIINVTGEKCGSAINAAHKRFTQFGPPRERNGLLYNKSGNVNPFAKILGYHKNADGGAVPEGAIAPTIEVFSSTALQVGFAGAALPARSYIHGDHGVDFVLTHLLSTGPLWEEIRMKGGAYGAHSHVDAIEKVFAFSTYRDPSPASSIEIFESVLQKQSTETIDDEVLTKMIIGAFSKTLQPKANPDKGLTDFFRFLTNIYDAHRENLAARILTTTDTDIKNAADYLLRETKKINNVIIANPETAKKAGRKFNVEVKALPV